MRLRPTPLAGAAALWPFEATRAKVLVGSLVLATTTCGFPWGGISTLTDVTTVALMVRVAVALFGDV
ncbi:MAG TPA: hypothetical protein VKW06_11520 [Candidatus Angelobacter sp.]|nr:hypothetical protein [Candidatus Angelobacter sp.]